MTVGLFHPAFRTSGGAEILAATWVKYLRRVDVSPRVITLALDEERWRQWFDGVQVRVLEKAAWYERLLSRRQRLERSVPRLERALSGCRVALATNFPCNVVLGGAAFSGRRLWFCNEPSRDFHLPGTNPRLHERVRCVPRGDTDAEQKYSRQLAEYEEQKHERWFADVVDLDLTNSSRFDGIVTLSEFGRDNVRRIYGRDSNVVPPIVRFPQAVARQRAGLDRTGLKVLAHSRLEVVKNVDTVVRGFGRFLREQPSSELHIVGEGGHLPRLKKLVVELGMAEHVRFHGYLSETELTRIYGLCDVFALLPLDEPFGLVFPEAAARGLLLVGPDHGGPFEIMDGGRLGFPCDPFSPESVAEAFRRIWRLTDSEVDARRVAADQACRARYSEDAIGPKLLTELGPSAFDR